MKATAIQYLIDELTDSEGINQITIETESREYTVDLEDQYTLHNGDNSFRVIEEHNILTFESEGTHWIDCDKVESIRI